MTEGSGDGVPRKPPPGGGRKRKRLPPNEGNTGRRKVSDEVMQFLVDQGLNGPEIVQALKDDYGVDYTRAAVSRWRTLHNMPARPTLGSMRDLVPWRVLHQDESDRYLRYLRTAARYMEGLSVTEPDRIRYEAVAREVASKRELSGIFLVIYYDHENGFLLVPARPGIDDRNGISPAKGLIFDPRFTDDGEPIRDKKLWQ